MTPVMPCDYSPGLPHHLEQGIALYHPQQHRSHAMHTPTVACLVYAAWTAWHQGYPEQALQRCQEARALAQDLSHPLSMAIAWSFTGIVYQFRGEPEAAQTWSATATQLAQEQGFPFWEATAMIVWGWALAMQGQQEEGMMRLQEGLRIFQTTGAEIQLPSWLALLAEVYSCNGQTADGLHTVDTALAILERTGERYYEAELYRLKGALYGQQQPPDLLQVALCLQQALDLAHQQEAKGWELRAAASLSRLWQRQGQHLAAYELLAPLYHSYTEGWQTVALQEARALLDTLTTPVVPTTMDGAIAPPRQAQPPAQHTTSCLPAPRWERKPVVVMVMSLTVPAAVQSTGLPADPWTLLAAWTQQCTDTVQAFGGHVLQHSPTLLTAVFGVPRTLDEMPQRAVQAAVAIQQRMAQTSMLTDQETVIRLAVHLGEVLVDLQADDPHTQLVALGETMTLPVQLLGHTPPGTILVSPQVGDQVAALYHLVGHPLPLGESTALLRASIVRASRSQRDGVAERAHRFLSPFVGRSWALATLHERLRQAGAGQGQVVAIEGAAGMGKSRLLAEFRDSLQGQRITYLEAHCHTYGRTTPYFSVRDLLRQHCAITDRDPPDVVVAKVQGTLGDLDLSPSTWAPYLLAILGVSAATVSLATLSPEALQRRTFEALCRLVLRGSQQQPLVLAIENLHWSDHTSAAYLTMLVEHLATASVLLVVTLRPEYRLPWGARPGVTVVSLPALTSQESLQIVYGIRPAAALADTVTQAILAKAEGNPFFLEELTRVVADEAPGAVPLCSVPDTIQGVIMARLDRLPDDTKRCLQVAAVLGREVPARTLAALWTGPTVLEQHVQVLQQQGFLYVHGETYRFTHALTQDVAYESMPVSHRQALHTAVGRTLESLYGHEVESVADRLAYHYAHSTEIHKAIRFLTLCADKAVRTHAHVDAASLWEEALAQTRRLPTAEQQPQYLELALQQAFSWSFLGRFRETLERLLPQRTIVEHLTNASLASAYDFRLTITFWALGEVEQARQWAQYAWEDAQRCQEPATLGKACYARALVAYTLGQFPQAIADGQQAVALFGQTAERHYLGLMHWIMGLTYSLQGAFVAALAALAEMAAIGDTTGDPRLQSAATWTTGWIAILRGEWEAGIAGLQRGIALATDPSTRSLAMNYLGFAYLEQGQLDQAIPLLQQALEQFRRFRYRQGHGRTAVWLSEAQLRCGDLSTARALAQEGLAESRAAQYAYGVGLAQRALGHIAQARGAYAEAAQWYAEALETFTALSARYEIGRTHLDYATLAARQKHTTGVVHQLQTAHALFEALQIPYYAARALHYAREYGVSLLVA